MNKNIFVAAMTLGTGCAAHNLDRKPINFAPEDTHVTPVQEEGISVRKDALAILEDIKRRDDFKLTGLTLSPLLGDWTYNFTVESESGLPIVLKGWVNTYKDEEYCSFKALIGDEEVELAWSAHNGASYWSKHGTFIYSANDKAWSLSPEEIAERKAAPRRSELLDEEINDVFPEICREIYELSISIFNH